MKLDLTIALIGVGGALVGYGLYRSLIGGEPGASATAAPESDASAPDAAPPVTYGEPKMPSPFPAGYRRITQSEVTPDLLAHAVSIRDAPGFTSLTYGTIIPISGSDAALVEQHYHEPLGPVKPWGYHHGVTLIRAV